jgi:hypothetical protein
MNERKFKLPHLWRDLKQQDSYGSFIMWKKSIYLRDHKGRQVLWCSHWSPPRDSCFYSRTSLAADSLEMFVPWPGYSCFRYQHLLAFFFCQILLLAVWSYRSTGRVVDLFHFEPDPGSDQGKIRTQQCCGTELFLTRHRFRLIIVLRTVPVPAPYII